MEKMILCCTLSFHFYDNIAVNQLLSLELRPQRPTGLPACYARLFVMLLHVNVRCLLSAMVAPPQLGYMYGTRLNVLYKSDGYMILVLKIRTWVEALVFLFLDFDF